MIFWDTDLQRIVSLWDGIDEIPRGRETNIAPAIQFTGSRFCSENDKLFIIKLLTSFLLIDDFFLICYL